MDLHLLRHWRLNGSYYARTAEAWLANMDRNRAEIVSVFSKNRWAGASRALVGARWRIFFMACAELWAYRGGEERLVRHYLFEK